MDSKHYGMFNLKYEDACKSQRVKHVVEKCDYEISCWQMPTEDRLHEHDSETTLICRSPLLTTIHIITLWM